MIAWNIGKVFLILCLIIGIRCTGLPYKTFSCKDGGYIAKEHFCDGISHCDDSTDEPPACNITKAQEFCGTYGLFRCPVPGKGCIDADKISDAEVYNKWSNTHSNWDINSTVSFGNVTFECNDSTRCVIQEYYMPEDVHQCFYTSNYFIGVDSSELMEKLQRNKKNCSFSKDRFPCDDELMEKLQRNKKNCSFSKDRFPCDDGKRCLKLEYVYDGYNNCFDGSDENENGSKVDHEKLSSCQNGYFPTPLGPKCMDTPPDKNCTEDAICDQECFQYNNTRKVMCSCHADYTRLTEMPNNFRCQHKDFKQDVIIYTTLTELKYLSLTTGESRVLQNSSEITALTATSDHLYYAIYSNNEAKIVKYSFISSSNNTIQIKRPMSVKCYWNKNCKTQYQRQIDPPIISMTVDHTGTFVFFISNSTLKYCNTTSASFAYFQLASQHINHVALDPDHNLLFYSYMKKNDNPAIWSIIKYNIITLKKETLIEEIDGAVKFLVIDESIKRLYWLQKNGVLFSVPFLGNTSEIRKYEHLENVLSITAHDSRVFYTKSNDGKIYSLQNRQKFTKTIGKSYNDRFNVFGYLHGSDEQFSVGHFITAKHLYAFRNKVLFDHAANKNKLNDKSKDLKNTKTSSNPPTAKPTNYLTAIPENLYTDTIDTITEIFESESFTEPSTQHSPKGEEQKREPESESGSSFWQIFSVIIVLIVAAFGLYVWYNRRRHPYTNFNARTWFRSNFNHTNDYDQNEV